MLDLRCMKKASLAKRIGIHRSNIGRYISGESTPSVSTIALMAEALDCSKGQILDSETMADA